MGTTVGDGTNRHVFRIAVFEGDGIGPEVMAPTLDLLKDVAAASSGFDFAFEPFPAGAGHYRDHGVSLPPASVKAAREADAILLAAMGLPDVRYPNGTEIVPQIELRIEMGLFAGVRPVFVQPGQDVPLKSEHVTDIDFVIVRESTEGLFASLGKGELIGDSEARETLVITRRVSEKLFDSAFRLARQRKASGRGKGLVHCIDKANVFQAFAFFRKIFYETAARYPDIKAGALYVDAAAMWMVREPQMFDVMVTENMFGDILSDLGAGLMGGLGMAPSADMSETHAVFQPCHGTAPDIAGRNIANPLAMILSAAMMLEWLGHERETPEMLKAGEDIRTAVSDVLSAGAHLTADLGGSSSTTEATEAVRRAYRERARAN